MLVEIEITEEMLNAGEAEYCLFDFDEPAAWIVPAIYRAMAAVDPSRHIQGINAIDMTENSLSEGKSMSNVIKREVDWKPINRAASAFFQGDLTLDEAWAVFQDGLVAAGHLEFLPSTVESDRTENSELPK